MVTRVGGVHPEVIAPLPPLVVQPLRHLHTAPHVHREGRVVRPVDDDAVLVYVVVCGVHLTISIFLFI